MLMSQRSRLIVIAATAGLMVAACGGNKPETGVQSKPALKVNGQVINDVELQIKAGMHSGQGAEKQRPVSSQLMEKVVGTELMRQAALAAKLDTDPIVNARIADSTRRILALAYVDQLVRSVKAPTNEEIEAYYNSHPALFAERMQYELREILLQPQQASNADIQAKLNGLEKFEPFEKWLTTNKIAHQTSPLSMLGDQVPAELLEKIKGVPPGGHVVVEGKGEAGMRVLFMLAKQKASLDLAQTKRDIAGKITDQRRKDALDGTMKSLRDKAKIEYVAPYTAKGIPVAGNE